MPLSYFQKKTIIIKQKQQEASGTNKTRTRINNKKPRLSNAHQRALLRILCVKLISNFS